MMSDELMLSRSFEILDRAQKEYQPSLIVPSYSGGYDSMVMLHVVARWVVAHGVKTPVHVLSADTGVSADGWKNFAGISAARVSGGAQHSIVRTPSFDKWVQSIDAFGLPYTPNAHKGTFGLLKRDAFRLFQKEHKQHWHDRIMFVTGVRRAESRARANTPDISRHGSAVYVNAVAHWQTLAVHAYRIDHDMPYNHFYDAFGNSGDCECNWTTNVSLDDVKRHAPKLYQVVKPISDRNAALHGYCYGQRGDVKKVAGSESNEQLALFPGMPNLCHGCARSKVTNADIDNALIVAGNGWE